VHPAPAQPGQRWELQRPLGLLLLRVLMKPPLEWLRW
jgi:hypothetical protein